MSNTPVASGYMKVYYRAAALAMNPSGADVPLHNTTQTWTIAASGGSSPYSFSWYRNGQLVSQTASYAAAVDTASFGLTVLGTDAHGVGGRKDMLIEVDGIRVQLTGPSIVYLSEGGGTWTATGRGGSSAYTFDWYKAPDDGSSAPIFVGSGPSWSGYLGEDLWTLTVQMQNAEGRMNAATMTVRGIGNDTCTPTPPALTCDP